MDNPDVPFDLTRRGEQRAATTSPIYARDRDGGVEGVGSGVFVEHGGRAFVVTASHVLTHYINSHELHTGGRFTIRINQRFFAAKDEDRYDVGFIPLTDAQRADLADVTFVTTDRLDLSDEAPEASYCIVGYRADDNSPEGTPSHVVAGWSVYAARSAPLDTYRQRQLSPADRLLLKFDRQQLFGADRAPVETEDRTRGTERGGRLVTKGDTGIGQARGDCRIAHGQRASALRRTAASSRELVGGFRRGSPFVIPAP